MAVPYMLPPPPAPLDDGDFVARLVRERPRLLARALRLTRRRDAADDLVQQTCLRALRFRHRFAAGSNFGAWTATILRRCFLHDLRRQSRERGLDSDERRTDVLAGLLSEASVVASRGEGVGRGGSGPCAGEVAGALAGLPACQRRVVILCDLQSVTYAEAARREQCPIGTVMSRLYRARRRLAVTLAAAPLLAASEVGPQPALVA